MDLFGNDKNKITGKKYQPVMSVTGLNDQGHNMLSKSSKWELGFVHFIPKFTISRFVI